MRLKKVIAWAAALIGAVTINARAARVMLAWSPSLDPRTAGYEIWYGANGPFIVTNCGLETNIVLTGLMPGASYELMVCGVDQFGGISEFANAVSYTPPMPPMLTPTQPAVVFGSSGVTLTAGASVTVAPGATVRLTVGVQTPAWEEYQWYFGNTALPSMNARSLWLTNVTAANAGSYYLQVSNPSGSVMSPPMTVTVVPLLASAYNGLFYETNNDGTADVEMASGGMLANCVVSSNGVYSGRVYVNNAGYPMTGEFDPYGNSETFISRASVAESNLDVHLHLNSSLPFGQLTGTVSNMDETAPWISTLSADSASLTNAQSMSVEAGLLSQTGVPLNGEMFLMMGSGQMFVSGLMFDGALFSESVPISDSDRAPIYASMYGGQGMFEGWISLAPSLPGGTMTWIREQGVAGTAYPNGFTNSVWAVLASP